MNENINLPIETRLYKTKIINDEKSHLIVDNEICAKCKNPLCTIVCPANVYKFQDETKKVIMVNYENCLECGACKICCKHIKWNYPEVRYGVNYKFE